MISVAATDKSDAFAFFSNYGGRPVHLAAPGVNVYSTMPGNTYGKDSGTSMACPHVTGAVALVWAASSRLGLQKVKQVSWIPPTRSRLSMARRLAAAGSTS